MTNGLMVWAHSAKRLCSKNAEALVKEFGLSHVEIGILGFLHDHPKLDTSRDIAEALLLAKSNVSNAVENLVQRGYLRREADSEDRRLIHLKLMDSAQELIQRGEADRTKLLAQLLSGFSDEEMKLLRSFSQRVYDNMQEMLRE